MLNVDLSKLAGGELQEKFNREITRVMQNMQDRTHLTAIPEASQSNYPSSKQK